MVPEGAFHTYDLYFFWNNLKEEYQGENGSLSEKYLLNSYSVAAA
jgi:hypothetical protein